MIDPDAVRQAADRADEQLDTAHGAAIAAPDSPTVFGLATLALAEQVRALRFALVDVAEQHTRKVTR